MCNSEFKLAARVLDVPDFFIVKDSTLLPNRYRIIYAPVPGQLPYDDQVENIAPPGASFPYGWDVEPD